MYIGKYNYDELRKEAINNPTAENINNLGEWFNMYGADFWNGECYDADGYEIRPVYKWDDESDTGEIIGYEMR